MLSSKIVLAALSLYSIASAAPAALEPKASATVTVCTGSIDPPAGCVIVAVAPDSCVRFSGGLSAWNKAVSNAQIPGGFVCTFIHNNGSTELFLGAGTWDLLALGFNDLTSSFTCSPV
ncbi:hypothetical protein BDQ12DRAFT_726059 [Crucibulum laeve]|uniref:Uncharacterized protein n=1 Tax=Crucibulum laeve TaxID=68775 RepID=A0A5C3LTL7_9AGAR|nr:hypothetical protein BDQ12DRAFT_726059 [Crucibulum laeve]